MQHSDDFFLHRLNTPLLAPNFGIPERNPTHRLIFVCGVPRSGTTLLTQLIAQYFDIGFIDHLTARFYKRPAVGAMLRRSVFGDRHETNYRSEYGRTENPLDVHHMGWFWRHYFDLDERGVVLGRPDPRATDYLLELLGAWQKPVVMLGHYPMLLPSLPGAVFVRIRRDQDAVVKSLQRAYEVHGGPFGVRLDARTPEEQVERIEAVLDARKPQVVVHYEDIVRTTLRNDCHDVLNYLKAELGLYWRVGALAPFTRT